MIHRHKRRHRYARCGRPTFPVYTTDGDAVTCLRCLQGMAEDVERSLQPRQPPDTGQLAQSFQGLGVAFGKLGQAMVQFGTDMARGMDRTVLQVRRR